MNQLLALCVFVTLVFAPSLMAQASGLFARVSSVTGSALLSNGSGPAEFAVTRGYALHPGDRVDTRQGGRVVIDLSDGSLVIVQPGTVLTIKDFRAAASVRELFEIAVGAVRVKIHHLTGKPNPYRMNSPTASIAVRGTEFDVVVGEDGNTEVDVFEGAVEVGRLDNPEERALIEAGRGVLVRPGQTLQLFGIPIAKAAPPLRAPPDRSRDRNRRPMPQPPVHVAGQRPPPQPKHFEPKPAAGPEPRPMTMANAHKPREQRYEEPAGVAEAPTTSLNVLAAAETPLLFRFNAFADLHLDTYENPAYGAGFKSSETRATLYRMSPQISILHSLGKGFVGGATVTGARSSSAGTQPLQTALRSDATFSSFSAFAARRFGRSGVGFSVERLRIGAAAESNEFGSTAFSEAFQTQTRVTAGITRQLGAKTEIAAYARYGLNGGATAESFASPGRMPVYTRINGTGNTKEAGVRIRGALTPRLSYGFTGNIQTSLLGLTEWRSNSVAAGIGYQVTPGTVVAIDGTTGVLRAQGLASPFRSVHVSVQRDISKRLFGSASFLNVWRVEAAPIPLWRTNYADFGLGWRFSPDWIAQYVVTRDNVFGRAQHGIALRYTFRWRQGS